MIFCLGSNFNSTVNTNYQHESNSDNAICCKYNMHGYFPVPVECFMFSGNHSAGETYLQKLSRNSPKTDFKRGVTPDLPPLEKRVRSKGSVI